MNTDDDVRQDSARQIAALEEELLLIGRHTNQVIRDPGGDRLERSAYLLLSRLDADRPMTMRELACSLGLDISTINRQTAALLRQGLVERIPDPDDGVAQRLRPTEEGLRRMHADREVRRRGTADLVGDWALADQEALVWYLRRLNKRIEERQGLTWPRRHDHTDHPPHPAPHG